MTTTTINNIQDSTSTSISILKSTIADQFLSARLDTAKRQFRGARGISQVSSSPRSQTRSSLRSVPENQMETKRSSPSSDRHSTGSTGSNASTSPVPPSNHLGHSGKGKEKEQESARDSAIPRSMSTATMASLNKEKVDWVVDLTEVMKGKEQWSQRERVILVIGSPTTDALSPILYNEAFANTLLLIGLTDPVPSIEALSSPSYLLSAIPDRTIHPTVHTFCISSEIGPTSATIHPLPAVIQEATRLAQQYLSPQTTTSRGWNSRGNSSESGKSTPPGSPSLGKSSPPGSRRLSTLTASRRSSFFGFPDHSRQSSVETFRDPTNNIPSDASLPTSASTPRLRSRFSSTNPKRDSMFTLSKIAEPDYKSGVNWGGGSVFDAVINFIPSPTEFAPERAMRDMLHQGVILTTGILPLMVCEPTNSKPENQNQPAISLIHVLPAKVPMALPGILEKFLLTLLPNFVKAQRQVLASVVTLPAWNTTRPSIGGQQVEASSGCDILLFGGLRCVAIIPDEFIRPRAFLPNWNVCTMSGTQPTAQSRSRPIPIPSSLSLISNPPSMSYDSIDARTPPASSDDLQPLPLPQRTFAAPPLGYPDTSPSTPDLDPSSSSSSSHSGIGEPPSLATRTEISQDFAGVEGKEKKGIVGWFKGRTRRRA